MTFHEPSFKVVYLKHPSLFATTKMLYRTGPMTFHPLVSVIFYRNTQLHGPTPILDQTTGSWMVLSLVPFSQEQLDNWLEVHSTTRSSQTKRISRNSSWTPSTPGANRMPFLAHLMIGFISILNLYGKTTIIVLLITLQLRPSDNCKNYFLNVFFTMKTKEPHLFEYVAHANTFSASTRRSVTLQFLLVPMNYPQNL